MKKLKGNSILGAFVFGVSLLMLCSFGTDACYTVLSRYKLQKITEAIALEYAADKARNYNYEVETEQEKQDAIDDIKKRYGNIYNTMGSGVLVFNIEALEYKSNRQDKETVVSVKTSSMVLPIFLKYVGIKKIVVHSNACAKIERIAVEGEIDDSGEINTDSGKYADLNKSFVEFSAPFEQDNKTTDLISAKNTGLGDFMIQFEYELTNEAVGSGGGFFILAGYKKEGESETNWVDIGDKAIDENNDIVSKICTNSTGPFSIDTGVGCLHCVNASSTGRVVFNLSKETENEGFINRINTLKIYKAGGAADIDQATGKRNNPCDPDFVQNAEDGSVVTPYYDYFKRKAKITLTILNNIKLIKKSEYNAFTPKANGSDTDIESTLTP